MENRGGKEKVSAVRFVLPMQELTSWFLLSWLENLEVAESHVLELQRSLDCDLKRMLIGIISLSNVHFQRLCIV